MGVAQKIACKCCGQNPGQAASIARPVSFCESYKFATCAAKVGYRILEPRPVDQLWADTGLSTYLKPMAGRRRKATLQSYKVGLPDFIRAPLRRHHPDHRLHRVACARSEIFEFLLSEFLLSDHEALG